MYFFSSSFICVFNLGLCRGGQLCFFSCVGLDRCIIISSVDCLIFRPLFMDLGFFSNFFGFNPGLVNFLDVSEFKPILVGKSNWCFVLKFLLICFRVNRRRMSTPARKRLVRNFKRLQQDPPASISGALYENNIMLWNAVIFGWVLFHRCLIFICIFIWY